MFKNPLLSYEKGSPSHQSKNQFSTTNYTRTSYDYIIVNLYDANEQIETITIKDKYLTCNVVAHHSKITLPGAPSRATYVPKQYNLVDQLDKMPTLISILDLLRLLPSHKTILDQSLQEASIPSNLNTDQF